MRLAVAMLGASMFCASTAVVRAQEVRVRLVDGETREPLGGLLVAGLGDANAIGPTVLTTSSGIAVVRMPDAGPHRLLVRHIGFAPVTTDPVVADTTGALVEITVRAQRITLGAVHVVASPGCSAQAESPSAGAADAWTAVRDALEASALTRDQRLVTTAGYRFHHQLRIDGIVDFADSASLGQSGERPFVAPAPALLERDGYFKAHDDGSESFFAPDEAVLLSPGFTQHHCVGGYPDITRDSSRTLFALSFTPRDRDTRPEIKGLIWIDSATSELRRVDFEYVRVALPAPADSLGGSVQFEHLASGAWIVSSWRLRIPRWRVVDQRSMYVVLDGYSEDGGVATVLRDLATPGPAVPRAIRGTVYDSIAGRPLSGAHVHLANSAKSTLTDSAGVFQLDSVGLGVQTVWADHPALDSLGIFSVSAAIDVTPQATSEVVLAAPSFQTLARRACGSAPAAGTGGVVFGTVHADSAGGAATASAVTIAWTAGERASGMTVTTDSAGNYAACGVPRAASVAISAAHGSVATLPVRFRLGAAPIERRDMTLPSRTATVAEGVADTSAVGTMHVLRVVSADGRPVVYANVSIAGGIVKITNEKGEVPLGAGRIHMTTASIRRIGFTPWFGTIDFPDTASAVTVTLSHLAQQLGEMRITGQKNPSSPFVQGFYDRWLERQKGLLTAVFIGPEELEFRHPDRITTVLRGLNGVQVKCDVNQLCSAYSTLPGSLSSAALCPMAVLIDGMQQYGYKSIDDLIDPSDVMAVEVYARAGNIPISLPANDAKCGVIAFWTGSRH